MTPQQRAALEALSFDPAPTPEDVWRESSYNVPELHQATVAEILSGVNRARRDDNSQPLGVVLQGRAGSGKTHLLGAVRAQIQREGGYFALISMISGRTFWESTALCLIESLDQHSIGWGSQLKRLLRSLTTQLHLDADIRDAISGAAPLTRRQLDTFIHAIRGMDGRVGRDCQDTARALVLNGAQSYEAQDVGYAHLISEIGDPAGREHWGMSQIVRRPQEIVRDISRMMALTLDPTVIAIDQIDTLFAQSTTAIFDQYQGLEEAESRQLGKVADGLLVLRDITHRTLTIVSCLPDTWELLRKSSPGPVVDRFRTEVLPDRIPTPEIGRAIIAKRFAPTYSRLHLVVDDIWPVRPSAFEDAPDLTPRELLRRVERHVQRCLRRDEIIELERLVGQRPEPADDPVDRQPTPTAMTGLDARFAELVGALDVHAALDHTTEDAHMPGLLAAGLSAWIDEQAPTGATYKLDPPPSRKPALHARLVTVLNEATENEAHLAFRSIASTNAIAVIARVKAACTMAGLDAAVPARRLVVLRRGPWPSGTRTREITGAFAAEGGIVLPISESDLKTFAALRHLSVAPPAHYQEWLRTRKPATNSELFRVLLGAGSGLGSADVTPIDSETVRREPAEIESVDVASVDAGADAAIELGSMMDGAGRLTIPLESLRRHTVIFAGSGSGKTVLIRRLVEECAREGVSSIVLDPNNDLARLGDAWPEPPAGWGPGDAEKAEDYLAHTEVIVWTPRIIGGRPLTFQPLPDFSAVLDSPDEFDQAISSAVAALAVRAGVHTGTKLALQGRAVLTEALQAFARGGGRNLRQFTKYLADLPEGISSMARAGKLATDLAETLKAAMVTDPLFGGDGATVDPGQLLTPSPGKRARISVISFVGLPTDDQRQGFVNQLQLALFAWIKRNPAGARPLGGLLVMDEAQTLAPATGSTPCTSSTIALASQARKYGLGLVFATQAPKGLHNQISGNATTQFFGLLNAPAQIDAARELAQAKGGRMPDIGVLSSGQFYAAGEGFSFVKVRTPLCLSYHPKAPLPPEDVIQRAVGKR